MATLEILSSGKTNCQIEFFVVKEKFGKTEWRSTVTCTVKDCELVSGITWVDSEKSGDMTMESKYPKTDVASFEREGVEDLNWPTTTLMFDRMSLRLVWSAATKSKREL